MMIIAMAILGFFVGGLSYRFYLDRKKKPEAKILHIGDVVKVTLDNVTSMGIFQGWALTPVLKIPHGQIKLENVAKGSADLWLVQPQYIHYVSPGKDKKLEIEPKTFEN